MNGHRRLKRWLMTGILSAVALAVLIPLLRPAPGRASADSPGVGSPAPDIRLPTLDGGSIELSQLRGKPVLINFWASWCVPCREEMPLLQTRYQRLQDQGLVILAVNYKESQVAVRAFQERFGLTFPIALDAAGDTFARYRILPLPTTYVVDRQGRIYRRVEGQMAPELIDQLIQAVL